MEKPVFRLNARLARRDYLRSRSSEKAYVERLAERGELLVVGNVAVDAANLVFRRFACDTARCVRTERRNGRPWFSGSCCTDLMVEVTPPEVRRLKALAQTYLARFPKGRKEVAKVAERIAGDEFLAETRNGETVLDDYPTNRCILSFLDGRGILRCAVNAMAEALDLAIERYKPDACFAYPLHYVDYEKGKWLLTVVCRRNYKMLGAAREAASMVCLTDPPPDAPPAYVALRREIEHFWGKRFWKELDRKARPLLR